MEPERWRKIEELYHAAIEVEEDEREGFLDLACAGDDHLRCEIASLLANMLDPVPRRRERWRSPAPLAENVASE